MKFYCFPKKQNLFLVYSNYQTFKSQLFGELTVQASPKNSIFFRLLKTRVGFFISSLFKHTLKTPNEAADYVGIIKNDNNILFEMKGGEILYVWKKKAIDKTWAKETFLGHQLIGLYTKAEFDLKAPLIQKALQMHWDTLAKKKCLVHGDLTHFNILYDKKNNVHFIDKKEHINSKLFDFFYFFAYLSQCLDRCQTISEADKKIIQSRLATIIKNICIYPSKEAFIADFQAIEIPQVSGLIDANREYYLALFRDIF